MDTVTVSPKYQVVIPKEIRAALKIRPGHKLTFVLSGDGLRLVPLRPLGELRGILKGVGDKFQREPDRVL